MGSDGRVITYLVNPTNTTVFWDPEFGAKHINCNQNSQTDERNTLIGIIGHRRPKDLSLNCSHSLKSQPTHFRMVKFLHDSSSQLLMYQMAHGRCCLYSAVQESCM